MLHRKEFGSGVGVETDSKSNALLPLVMTSAFFADSPNSLLNKVGRWRAVSTDSVLHYAVLVHLEDVLGILEVFCPSMFVTDAF